MNRKRLISALLLCSMVVLSSKAADVSIVEQVIKDQTGAGTGAGVAVNAAGDTLTITNSTFTNNSGGYSGGIHNSGNLIITDGTADTHTTFEGNHNSEGWGGGGAIYSYENNTTTSVSVGDYTSFVKNYTDNDNGGDSGGAIYVGDATLTIGDNVNFSENYATSGRIENEGGVLAYGGKGGAIYAQNSDVTIENNLNVEGNKSIYSGGGIGIYNYEDGHSTVIGENATFTDNQSTERSGGAISNTGGSLEIGNNATFQGNSAATSGGAIYNDGKLVITGAEFTGNSAQQGGAIYNAQNATASLTDVTVNAAGEYQDTGKQYNNDIVNAGEITTATTATGENTFASNITNTGAIKFGGTNTITETSIVKGDGEITNSGTLNLEGNAGGYTGKFSQTDSNAVTNVTGTFFNGENEIKNGALNIGSSTKLGSLTLNSSSIVADAVDMHIYENSSLILNGGSAVLNSGDTWAGTVNLSHTDSTLTVGGLDSYGKIIATAGTLDISGDFTLAEGSSIAKEVITRIDAGDNYTVIKGAEYTLDDNDIWEGTVTIEGGTLNVDGRETATGNGTLDANSGALNIINNGNVNITQNSDLAADVVADINAGSTLTVNGGTATLNTGDTWAGTVNLTGGTLKVNNVTNGAIKAEGGTLNLVSQNFNVATGSIIADAVTTSIDENSTLTVNGGTATLNTGDTWNGGVTLDSGTLNIDNSGNIQNSTIQANDGALNITGGTLNVGEGSVIQNEVALNVANNTGIDITTGGVVGVNDNDTLDGTTTLNGGTLNYGMTNSTATNITANTGYLNLLEDSVLAIQDPSNIADAVVVDIQKGSTLETNANTVFNLNGGNEDPLQNDKWNGLIRNWSGTVNVKEIVNNDTSALQQYGGTTNIDSNSNIILDNVMSEVTSGEVNVTNNSTLSAIDASILQGGDLNVDSTSKFVSFDNGFNMTNLNHSGSLIGLNNAIEDYTLTSSMNIGTTGDNQGDFTLDVYGRSNGEGYNDSDRFFADVLKNASDSESATVNIADWNLGGDIFGWDAPIDKHINLGRIFNYNTLEGNVNFTETDKEIFTPIGWYRLNNVGGAGGSYTMDLTRFNPQVYRGQVTTLAQWMNQLAIDDMLFNHSMLLPSFKDEDGGTAYSGMMANRYASTMPQYAPYQYSRKNGGLWCKMYGTFETLQMSQGLNNVGNNAYGTLIGADFGLKELKHGWKFMPTAYIGYNGAHQYYSGLGAYQNGGQAGFLGTWYKNNFIIGGLIYGGVYQNSLDIAGHTDNTFNYFAGAATKLAYNWRFHRDWVLQPNLFLAYNFFGQQNWHSDFGQMGMMSGLLNGINLAPGLNLIWEKETFSIYATLQYMYNLNGAVGGRAGNVDLPHLYMDRGYIQYGIGFTKRFTDRFSGYFQTVFRNVGRTGVGFQLGFNFLLGK